IDHCCTENYACLTRGELLEIFEDACCDSNARRTQDGSDEDVPEHVLVGQKVSCGSPSEKERRNHTENSDEQRRPSDFDHLSEVRFKTDLEQQNDHAQFGERC